MFKQIFKRRFYSKTTLAVLVCGLVLLILSVFIGNMGNFLDYCEVKNENSIFLDGFPWNYSKELAARYAAFLDTEIRSNVLSFWCIMENSLDLYGMFIHLLLPLPFIALQKERQDGYLQVQASRAGMSFFMEEALADSAVAYLYGVIPLLLFWGAAVLVGHPLYPVGQDFSLGQGYLFSLKTNSGNIIWLHLFLILVTSAQYFLRGFFLYILSFLLNNRIALLFSSLIYSYGIRVVFMGAGLYEYGAFHYIHWDMVSPSPFLVTCFLNLLLTVLLFFFFYRKERLFYA